MGTLLTLIIVPVTILGFVCRDPSSCPNETFGHWDEEYWGERRCSDAFCERCSLDSTFSSSANSFSNFGFIVIGVIVVVLAFEDYVYFHQPSNPIDLPPEPDSLLDYTPSTPPNVVVGSAGPLSVLLCLGTASSFVYAGVGSFAMHAGVTYYGYELDITSCYTLALNAMGAIAAQHLHFLRPYRFGPHAIAVLGLTWMYFAHVVPLDVWRDYDVLTLLPIIAALNYAMLITLHATGASHIRLRSQQDWWLILVSLAWMGSAYFFQLNDREEAWCNPDSPFQAHAYWHVGMAVACLFRRR
ncbi:hypothetical protein TeGR_g1738 [Tetraparma gracilis]|uniref:Ceramidase n=1 Tax=Tetraparma gracilis TaxID=2962635 RepID=A0ABQ6MTX5_9STRA|nr:hypothetical protein TeGR_g1738 [Tetraparma gracilis]